MTPEERKEYNKKYYSANKTIILDKIGDKQICEFCLKSISHGRLKKHQTTSLCKNAEKQIKLKSTFSNVGTIPIPEAQEAWFSDRITMF